MLSPQRPIVLGIHFTRLPASPLANLGHSFAQEHAPSGQTYPSLGADTSNHVPMRNNQGPSSLPSITLTLHPTPLGLRVTTYIYMEIQRLSCV